MMISLLLYNLPSAVHSEKKEADNEADEADGDEGAQSGKPDESMEVDGVEHGKDEMADSPAATERQDQRDVTSVLGSSLRRASNKAAAGSTLIVVPMSLIAQWRDEIERFSDLSVYVYYADKRADERTLRMHDVVITSYGTLAAEAKQYQAQQLQQQKPRSAKQHSLTKHKPSCTCAHPARSVYGRVQPLLDVASIHHAVVPCRAGRGAHHPQPADRAEQGLLPAAGRAPLDPHRHAHTEQAGRRLSAAALPARGPVVGPGLVAASDSQAVRAAGQQGAAAAQGGTATAAAAPYEEHEERQRRGHPGPAAARGGSVQAESDHKQAQHLPVTIERLESASATHALLASRVSVPSAFSDTERDFYQAVYTRSKTQIEGYVKEGQHTQQVHTGAHAAPTTATSLRPPLPLRRPRSHGEGMGI